MWVALKTAGCYMVAFGVSEKSRLVTLSARSDVPLLWRRLVVAAPTHQWLRRWQPVECMTKSQRGAAWGHLCHALQSCTCSCMRPRHGSRPGSSLVATGRVQWLSVSCCSSWTASRARWARALSCRTRTCHHQYDAWLAASAVRVAHPGNSDHWPLRLAQLKRMENSRALTRRLRPSVTCWTSGDSAASTQQQCCASSCHGVRTRGRSADCQVKWHRTPFRPSTVPVSHNFFNSLLTPRFVLLISGNLSVNLFAVYPFKYKFLIKSLSSSLNTMLIVDKHCRNDCCDEFLVPQIDRKSKQFKEQWHGQFYLQSVWGKTRHFKHRKYQNLWMNNKVRGA